MELAGLVAKSGCRALCLVGTAKNVGKTTVFNHLCRQLSPTRKLGLMSTGRDGEPLDLVTGEPKPAVYVPGGALLATAEHVLTASEVYAEILQVLPLDTRFGSITVGRVREAGTIELVGPDSASGVRQVVGALFRHGAELVLVDGSIDRRAAAAPAITGNVILVTGAALAPSLPAIAEQTALWLELFSLGPVKHRQLARAAARAVGERAVTLLDQDGRPHPLRLRTALDASAAIYAAVDERTAAVVLGGALTDQLLQAFLAYPKLVKRLVFVVHDATRVFVGRRVYQHWLRAGGRVEVVAPIRVLALAVNPAGPGGSSYDPEAFFDSLSRIAHPLPTFDVVMGLSREGEAAWSQARP
ncbi:MAG TPA: hypothetical protein DCM14_00475 [Clostridiales bacterium UBA8153]|nr:hypothetical protein [Clostridiales bacterium UBA8153]